MAKQSAIFAHYKMQHLNKDTCPGLNVVKFTALEDDAFIFSILPSVMFLRSLIQVRVPNN